VRGATPGVPRHILDPARVYDFTPRDWRQVSEGLELLPVNAGGTCTLCECPAVANKFGFRVCGVHVIWGENEPRCPVCALNGDRP
jgi:hypothetical protein